jgi:GNAT superfamily N-acetyltransferase
MPDDPKAASNQVVIDTPGDATYQVLDHELVAFNRSHADWNTQTFTALVRDANDRLLAGARAIVRFGAVEIRGLWVDGSLRGKGVGRTVVMAVENHSAVLGARMALLDTYDFQARPFYEKLGYQCFATFEYPNGAKRFYMSRSL